MAPTRNFLSSKERLNRIDNISAWITAVVQGLLTLVLVIGIVLSFKQIPGLLKGIITDGGEGIRELLAYVAEIIIVYELILVVNLRDLNSVVEILMIAFTRELVIKEMSIVQLAVGVLCIGGLFAIDKWLIKKEENELDKG